MKNAIVLHKNKSTEIGPSLRNAIDNNVIEQRTEIELKFDDKYLLINFQCLDNPYVQKNMYTQNNSEMWKQEVFEVFIAKGNDDPDHYLEIEINPNNALFCAWITNKDKMGSSLELKFVHESESGIEHKVTKSEKYWEGSLNIPLSLIGYDYRNSFNDYRINFFRIILHEKPNNEQWNCSKENSIFACWISTESPTPNFHRTRYMGSLKLKTDKYE